MHNIGGFYQHTIARAIVLANHEFAGILIHDDNFSNFQPNVAQNGGAFTWDGNNGTTQAVDPTDAGNQTLQFNYYTTGDDDAMAEQRFSLGSLHQELWMSYRLYVPSNYIHRNAVGSDNNKGWFNFWGDTYTNQDVAMRIEFLPVSDTQSRIVAYAKQNQNTFSSEINSSVDSDGRQPISLLCIDTPDLGQWMDVVIQAKVSDRGATNGRLRVWKNGALFCDFRDMDNSSDVSASSNAYNGGYLLGYANSGFAVNPVFNIDDFKIGTSADSIGFVVPA